MGQSESTSQGVTESYTSTNYITDSYNKTVNKVQNWENVGNVQVNTGMAGAGSELPSDVASNGVGALLPIIALAIVGFAVILVITK